MGRWIDLSLLTDDVGCGIIRCRSDLMLFNWCRWWSLRHRHLGRSYMFVGDGLENDYAAYVLMCIKTSHVILSCLLSCNEIKE